MNKLVNNRLLHVRDGVRKREGGTDYYGGDYEASEPNFSYDATGNLTRDIGEGISEIDWYASGKLRTIKRAVNSEGMKQGADLKFRYDAMGQRISKEVVGNESEERTYYVRDASGNLMGVYEWVKEGTEEEYRLKEYPLYGSSRLGIWNVRPPADKDLLMGLGASAGIKLPPPSLPVGINVPSGTYRRVVGQKQYEITNHLGNVLATVSDRKIGYDTQDTASRPLPDGVVEYYESELVSMQDYYPYGAHMNGRTYSSGSYRFGFNGKENDNEVKGNGNQQDYGFRIYDTRLGKFLSVDPLTKEYPELTPYQFSSNRVIDGVDWDGLEHKTYTFRYQDNKRSLVNVVNHEMTVGRAYGIQVKVENSNGKLIGSSFVKQNEPPSVSKTLRTIADVSNKLDKGFAFDGGKDDLTIDQLKTGSNVLEFAGTGATLLGYGALFFPGTQAAGILLIEGGSALSTAADAIQVGIDLKEGNNIKAGINIGANAVGFGVSKKIQNNEKLGEIDKQILKTGADLKLKIGEKMTEKALEEKKE